MTKLVDFALFQGAWFAAVTGAAGGEAWWGPAAVALLLAARLAALPRAERGAELRFALAVGLAGGLLDSGLRALDLLRYPTSAASALAPPFIVSLWTAFALLPRTSLAWLRGRAALAALLGAVGGPLSFLAGVRLGAVAPGSPAALAWAALALEYALVTPALVRLAPR